MRYKLAVQDFSGRVLHCLSLADVPRAKLYCSATACGLEFLMLTIGCRWSVTASGWPFYVNLAFQKICSQILVVVCHSTCVAESQFALGLLNAMLKNQNPGFV